ncbi:MAG: carbohydrate kinase family protein [Candidatus Limnocylindrales bacterium]
MSDEMRASGSGDRDIDVLVLGEINPDVIVRAVDPRPHFGQVELLVDTIDLVVGSSSAIFACGAARLGLRVAFVGVVGDDAMGRFMLDTMRTHGIDVSACRVDEVVPTGASVILAGGADRAILTAPGTVPLLRDEDVPAALVDRARHLHVGSVFLLDALRPQLAERFAAVRRAGITTSFDCNWDPSGSWDGGLGPILAQTTVFFPNAAEAQRITGRESIEEAALALAALGPRVVAVKCGADGALAGEPDGTITRVPAIAVDMVDTTGAGDSFDAGFLAAWLADRPLRDCLAVGVSCGSLSTRRVGGTAAQPTLAAAAAAARSSGLLA